MNAWLAGRVLFPLHERIKRKPTFARLRELEESQWFDADRLAEVQLSRLRQLLTFAHAHVPYYRALLDECGLEGGRLETLAELQRLPVLTREDIRTRFEDLRARARLPGVHRRASGGSTGTPVTVLVDMGRMGMGEAARLRAQGWFGVRPGAREIVFWGTPFPAMPRQERIRRVRDWWLNSHVVSAFDLGEESLARHAETILRRRPAKLYGYASAISLLAEYFQRQKLAAPAGLRAAFTTAEPLFDFQRSVIQNALGCGVGVEYGCRDGGLVALECPQGGLHIVAEGMLVEILNPDPEGRGEIVLTNLDSYAFPIIRYRTGDVGSLDPSPCPCGRRLPKLAAIEGRRTDFLVTSSGRVLHALSAIYILRDLPVVREFRVVQEDLDHLVVHVVPAHAMTNSEVGEIRSGFGKVFGGDMRIDVVQASAIARTSAGKFRYVESKIAPHVLEGLMRGQPQGA